jgi:predicted NUDIX family NTP pyrophosphohydrolase
VAQVDRLTVEEDVNHLLAWAIAAWEELPEVEREIDTWDLEDQIVFIEEWPLEERRLRELAEYAQAGALTTGQRARYERLLKLVEERRPIIERLLRS